MVKNLLFLIFLVLFIFSFTFTVSAQKGELMNKVYAYYPLDGNTVDKGPNHLDGDKISENRSMEDRFGNNDSALSFSEKSDSLSLPVNINPEKMPELTVALWLKVEKPSERSIVFTNSSGSFARSLIIDSREKRPRLSVSAGSNQQVYGGISIPLDQWIFTAISWNAESGQLSLYFADQNKNFSSISTNNINPEEGSDFITLGKKTASGDWFEGSMDELMIWNQILTQNEITELAF